MQGVASYIDAARGWPVRRGVELPGLAQPLTLQWINRLASKVVPHYRPASTPGACGARAFVRPSCLVRKMHGLPAFSLQRLPVSRVARACGMCSISESMDAPIRMPHDSPSTTSEERVRTFDTLLTVPCIHCDGGAIKITLHDVREADTGKPMVLVIETRKGSTRHGWADIYLGERPVIAVPGENPPAAEAYPLPVDLVVGSYNTGGLPSVPLMGSEQHLPYLSLPALALEPGSSRFVVGQPADPARFSSRSPLPGGHQG